MEPRVTQRDVARAAGVSNAAVSLALRASPSIPAKTQRRIKKIAERLGYAPDPMLAGLAAYRISQRPAAYQSNLAWINGWPDPELLRLPGWDFSDYHAGALRRAKELGYNLEEICLKEIDFKAKRLEKILTSKGITGLLLPPCFRAGEELKINFQRFSAVRFGYSYRFPVLHTVMNAQFHTVLDMFQRAAARGYRRIGIVLTKDLAERTSWNFLGGFVTGQRFAPKADRIEPLYLGGPSVFALQLRGDPAEIRRIQAEKADALARWIRKNRVDCVIGNAYWPLLRDMGLKVGYADLAVARADTQLSGMYQNSVRIGVTAVDFLVSMMRLGEAGLPDDATEISIKSRWMEGKTLPKLN